MAEQILAQSELNGIFINRYIKKILIVYQNDIFDVYIEIMGKSELIHIRVGQEMKKQIQRLIDIGLFSTEAEIAREGIRSVLLKYMEEKGFEDNKFKGRNENR